MSGTKNKSKSIIVAFAISFLIFLYAPVELYSTNRDEFWFSFGDLFPLLLGMTLVSCMLLTLILWLLERIHPLCYRVGLAGSAILYLCTYIQGNFLVGNLPPLDGTTIDWSEYDSGRIASLLLWLVVTAVVITAVMLLKEKFPDVVQLVSGCMTLMLAVTGISVVISNNALSPRMDLQISTEQEWVMSEEQNFVILLLDAVDSRTFAELLEQHPEYGEQFADFTYYENTMSGYPFTKHAIPYLLSGMWYENDEDFNTYMTEVYHAPLFEQLSERGYRMNYYETEPNVQDEVILQFDNIHAAQYKVSSYLKLAKQEVKLIGLRYAPYDLKKMCLLKKAGFDELRVLAGGNISTAEDFSDSNRNFMDIMENTEIATDTQQNQFKFIHLEGAHVPFRYDAEVNEVAEGTGTYEMNVEAAMTVAETYIEKLKDGGVYDNTVLIIAADHGYDEARGTEGRQCPLLLIKGRGERHDTLQISQAPISHGDMQEAYTRLLDGAVGTDVFDWQEGDARERRYLLYVYEQDDRMMEYIQKGYASDMETLVPTGRIFER